MGADFGEDNVGYLSHIITGREKEVPNLVDEWFFVNSIINPIGEVKRQ